MIPYFHHVKFLGCVDTFESSQGKFANGGSRNSNVNTDTECATSCLADSGCVGYDFNSQGNSCWIHKNANSFNNLQTDSSNVITNYQRIPCGNLCPTNLAILFLLYWRSEAMHMYGIMYF